MIVSHVLAAVKEGRSPIVLTERREHLDKLEGLLAAENIQVIAMRGGQSAKEAKAGRALLEETANFPGRVLLATGKFVGEGFDDPRLDALFLTLPISWRRDCRAIRRSASP